MTTIPIILRDGSFCEDDSLSFWYDENERGEIIGKTFCYVMDFSQAFPYWQELKPPKGYNDVVKIGEVWYWTYSERPINHATKPNEISL